LISAARCEERSRDDEGVTAEKNFSDSGSRSMRMKAPKNSTWRCCTTSRSTGEKASRWAFDDRSA
jgi:hypothetical protein